MDILRKEIETAVNMSRKTGAISKICLLICPSTSEVKFHIEVVAEWGSSYPFKAPVKSSNNYDEILSEFKDAYPEYFI